MTLATEASDGQTGIHLIVVRTHRAKNAISIARHEAMTHAAQARRRGAALRPGSVVVSLWPDE
ncbi:hypothetical protein [Streptomyces sp. NPDC058989]|uniref:hypothetical protein n=1 Tax=Streptomyces sp. NPDC058989 TaxID=3346686 RepID=UPI0036A3E540